MKNTNIKLDPKLLSGFLSSSGRRFSRYAIILFLLLVIIVYAFVLLQIDNLSNVQPSSTAVSAEVKSVAIPHINPATVQQIQSLQNNSVNVQALFNQARTNPFQE